jgi:hypothetical protein
MRIIFALLLIAAITAPVRAKDVDTGKFLLPYCKQIETNPRDVFTGICVGIADAIGNIGPYLQPNLRFCPPDSISGRQFVKVLIAYIEAHPEQQNQLLHTLAIKAFYSEWPCPK